MDFSKAECRGAPPQWWDSGTGPDAQRAKMICAGCPIKAACAAEGSRMEHTVGIWGGKSFGRSGWRW